MQTSDKGIIALIGHEGIVPGPYFDSQGILSAYVGHTKAAGGIDPADLPAGMPVDFDAALREAFRIFREDLAKFEAEVERAITVPVEQHEFDAAVSFHFNTGAIARADWVKKLNAGDRAGAAAAIMNWLRPASITGRRTAERDLFQNGTYPTAPITVWQLGRDRHVVWKPSRRLSPVEALALLGTRVTFSTTSEVDGRWLPPLINLLIAFLKGKTNV
ncbi:lysozyme [Thioclava sp. GXIMD2076]|uniref:lysozyme n=1 Tax=Thioclava sp. GXIMD2076 TaxID=3131931 RepID=UPI0030D0665F